MSWFLPRKRSLLAPFAVGTVDQALLSVLQTRHFFVRLFALSHKTVIFDEVHAYDTYMSTLFAELLGWLRVVGASVVLLSATLPAQMRQMLLSAYMGVDGPQLPSAPYPVITWATETECGVIPLSAPQSRTVAVTWIDRDPETIAARLAEALCDGGCAAVICNTVARAQTVYRVLQAAKLVAADDRILFHARYPFAWRDEIEKTVLARFGKQSDRPAKAIVVATQVIEQSLDLDFDFMISDLAPVDLLLQRAGRLQRHTRAKRPPRLATPRLLVAAPQMVGNLADFGDDGYVYEPFVLLRSYLTLKDRDSITLPDETSGLIEAVYGEEMTVDETSAPAFSATLQAALRKMQEHEEKDVLEARKRLIPRASNDRLLYLRSPSLEEDSPELHEAFQALTRLGPRSIALVCLHYTPQGLSLEPDEDGPLVNLEHDPDSKLTRLLAQHTVSISQRAVVNFFLTQGTTPKAWREHPLLRDHYLVEFSGGTFALTGTPYRLRLSRQYGLEIEKEA